MKMYSKFIFIYILMLYPTACLKMLSKVCLKSRRRKKFHDGNDSHTCIITNSTYFDRFNISSGGESLQISRLLNFEEINRVYL